MNRIVFDATSVSNSPALRVPHLMIFLFVQYFCFYLKGKDENDESRHKYEQAKEQLDGGYRSTMHKRLTGKHSQMNSSGRPWSGVGFAG